MEKDPKNKNRRRKIKLIQQNNLKFRLFHNPVTFMEKYLFKNRNNHNLSVVTESISFNTINQ